MEKYDGSPFTEDEMIRIPIIEERLEVTKTPVVVEEVIVGKRKIQETKQVQDIIKKEEARMSVLPLQLCMQGILLHNRPMTSKRKIPTF